MECDTCVYYKYDEEYEEYCCDYYMDQDDLARFSERRSSRCPYWRSGDEYEVVKHQM